jgi:hypothetical protein
MGDNYEHKYDIYHCCITVLICNKVIDLVPHSKPVPRPRIRVWVRSWERRGYVPIEVQKASNNLTLLKNHMEKVTDNLNHIQ